MNKQNQNGSALAVIVIILIVAIVAALGFVAWKNFINKDNTPTQPISNNTQSEPVTKFKTAQTDATFPIPLSWDYPETWSLKTTGSGPSSPNDTSVQTFNLISPSGDYSVIYSIGINGGRGGTCDPEYAGTVQYINQQAIDGLSDGRFVEFVGDAYNVTSSQKELLGYSYRSGITSNSAQVREARVGTTTCFFGLGGVMLDNERTYDLLGASIKLNKFTDSDGYAINQKDIQTIKDVFKTDEYKQAVNILLSTKLHRS